MSISNRPYTLFTAAAAGTGTPAILDYRFDGTQNRMVFCILKDTLDTISIQVSPDETNYCQYYLFPTGTTTGAITVSGPVRSIRAVKVGSTATCNVLMLG